MTPLNDKLLAVPVTPDAYDFKIAGNTLSWNKTTGCIYCDRELDGTYSILGLCSPKEIGFDCGKHVDGIYYSNEFCYKDYMAKKEKWLDTPEHSFRSLLQSKGLDSGHYLIIEKI